MWKERTQTSEFSKANAQIEMEMAGGRTPKKITPCRRAYQNSRMKRLARIIYAGEEPDEDIDLEVQDDRAMGPTE